MLTNLDHLFDRKWKFGLGFKQKNVYNSKTILKIFKPELLSGLVAVLAHTQ